MLITGVGGFLGRTIARHFLREGWRVVGLDDVATENALGGIVYHRMRLPHADLQPLLTAESPLACIHCAGRASVPLSMEDPAADFRDNTVLTFEVLDALRRWAPRCRFLLLSSAAVYGDPVSLPVSEEHAVAPLSPYGYHKRQCELLCEEFSRIYDLPTVAVRIFSAYGPGLRRQVVWDICAKALGNEVVGLRGTGNESRDFIHAHDVARALALLASAGTARGEVYNLANGEETTIRELAERLVATLGLASSVEFDGAATPAQPLRWRADLGRVASLGFRTEVPLDRGLCETAAWARAELG